MSGSPNSYEKMVLSHLEKVEQLPPEVQADIAKRVGIYLKLASAAKTDELLACRSRPVPKGVPMEARTERQPPLAHAVNVAKLPDLL